MYIMIEICHQSVVCCEPHKNLILCGVLVFQIDFWMGSSIPFSSSQMKEIIDLTEHVSFSDGFQTKQSSSDSFGFTDIDAIFLKVSSGNHSSNKSHFHLLFSSHNSSIVVSSIFGGMGLITRLLKGLSQAQE